MVAVVGSVATLGVMLVPRVPNVYPGETTSPIKCDVL